MRERITASLRKTRNQAEWRNPSNWRYGILGVYTSRRDSRLIVPKKNPMMGWTLNFGHSAAPWIVVGLTLIPLVRRLIRR